MCCSSPDVPTEVNTAKCWAIPVMVFAIFSCIGFLGGAWIQGVGGILSLIGSSILICCGPKAGGGGAGSCMAAFVLMLLGAIAELVGAVIGLILYFGVVDTAVNVTCNYDGDTGSTSGAEQGCLDFVLGITAIIIYPSVGLGVVAGVLALVAAIMAMKAKNSLGKPATPAA